MLSAKTGVRSSSGSPQPWWPHSAEGSTNSTSVISFGLFSVMECPSFAIKTPLRLLENNFLYWFKPTEITNIIKYTTSARNCQAWELKIHRPQVFIRQIKPSGWRDPWKENTKEACYTQVQICFPFTASERSGENVCSMSLSLVSVIPTAPSEGRKAILSIHGVDFLLLACFGRSCRPSGRSELANLILQSAHITPWPKPPS